MAMKQERTKARLPPVLLTAQARNYIVLKQWLLKFVRFMNFTVLSIGNADFEYTDVLGKFLPDSDRPNAGVFSLQDDDEQWMSLRYDLTAPLARYFSENFETLPKPYRSYRYGPVFRNEKPGPGRFRQFMQFDADIVGAPTVLADAEICMMAADSLERLGIQQEIMLFV
ncbi:ATP phosphoribosyltransferase regulatory subunit [Bartonella sp. 11B]|uniref:ATP phosphoribosyltransferase regulatory subunit n=1 Tax=Bartonella sp. 11B TaxID=1933908 RepID=UPI0009C3CEEF|nr:ATP phosphoribosyltransferase regulatory subunit [Bartonella sp. 11B]AQX23355.1 histidyl-tRNA synthetase [Bartonella sp. 11B]